MKKVLVILLFVALATVIFATAPLAGTKIKNQAAATFVDHLGIDRTVLSNQVITNVLPVYSVDVTPDQIDYNGVPGGTMQFQYKIENSGNAADYFAAVVTEGANNFTPENIEIFYDANGNGEVDADEVPWTDDILIGAGDFAHVVIKCNIPSSASEGNTAQLLLAVTSVNDATVVDNGNQANITVCDDAVVTIFKYAIPAQVAAGDAVTFVISGSNVGNATANDIEITDVLPAGVTFVSVSPDDDSTDESGGTVTFSLANLDPGEEYSFEINVTVNPGVSGNVSNQASLAYKLSDNTTSASRDSNISTIKVGGNGYDNVLVNIGPNGDPNAIDPNDVQTQQGMTGTIVSFTNTIKNNGNAIDTINVITESVDPAVPAELIDDLAISFYMDALIPLTDSDDDGRQDTGPLAPGDEKDVIVKIYIPYGLDELVTSIAATIKALSSNDPSVTDTTVDIISPIIRPDVLIGNAAGTATDNLVGENTESVTADPGSYHDFPLDIVNNGHIPDSYSLSAMLPAGWTVRYYIDLDGDGTLGEDELTLVTSTGTLPVNSGVRVIARVIIPSDAEHTGAPEDVVFIATSNNDPANISSSHTNEITINAVYGVVLAPSRNGSVVPGNFIEYEHTLTNTGNTEETINITVSTPKDNWTYELTSGGVAFTGSTIPAGGSVTFTLTVTPANDAIPGTTDIAYINAVVQGQPSVTSEITDVTFITSSNVTITKNVDKDSAEPGEILTYTLTYENTGEEAVTNVILYDTIPFYTSLNGIGAVLPDEYSTDYGVTWTAWPAADLSLVTNLKWVIGNLSTVDPASSVSFSVKIDE